MLENWEFLGLIIVILLTPGPTNTLLAASGVQAGYKKSLVLIPAEALGYLCSITLWGFVLKQLLNQFPTILPVLKLIAAIYIIGLSIILWNTANITKSSQFRTINYKTLFTITFLNPKAFIFAVTIFPLSTWENFSNYLTVMLSFLLVLIPVANIWIFFGHVLNNGNIKGLSSSVLQRCAAVILTLFCLPLIYTAFTSL